MGTPDRRLSRDRIVIFSLTMWSSADRHAPARLHAGRASASPHRARRDPVSVQRSGRDPASVRGFGDLPHLRGISAARMHGNGISTPDAGAGHRLAGLRGGLIRRGACAASTARRPCAADP
ncbi:hypothetical protein C884_00619 [Kocuria palustris PEL]|uniref:Uncharacterized protein n=1 Tax=Kocuria palustris PEL TaxID=1236550 RepID=M2XU51_9MICC|nr:hypothetical protein C884_00619 [Kocuria palustris PEL]